MLGASMPFVPIRPHSCPGKQFCHSTKWRTGDGTWAACSASHRGNYRAWIQPGLIWLQTIYWAGWRCLRKQTARMAETVHSVYSRTVQGIPGGPWSPPSRPERHNPYLWWHPTSMALRESNLQHLSLFLSFFFLDMDHFKSLCWICYNIASEFSMF